MNTKEMKKGRLSLKRMVFGAIFALLFIFTLLPLVTHIDIMGLLKISWISPEILQVISIFEIAITLFCIIPQKKADVTRNSVSKVANKLTKRSILSSIFILLAIPFTIYIGIRFFGDRKYYFISLLIILETIIPFCMVFESRKPQARELIVISVLCAIAVAGRTVFVSLPQFKIVVAVVIISGICFGGETGFLVGAISAFVSNFFFGQGPWTPWQMFSFGIIGFISGILVKKGLLPKTKTSLSIFGFVATLVIYGGIMNAASVIMFQDKITLEMIIFSYSMGLPFDMIHALSTAFFLWFISMPMIDKLERIKSKYGLI